MIKIVQNYFLSKVAVSFESFMLVHIIKHTYMRFLPS